MQQNWGATPAPAPPATTAPDVQIGEVLSTGARAGFASIGVFAPFAVVNSLIATALAVAGGWMRFRFAQQGSDVTFLAIASAVLLVVALGLLLITCTSQPAYAYAVGRQLAGRPASFGEALGHGFSRAPAVAGALFLGSVAIAIGLCPCIFPALVPFALLNCVIAAMSIERLGPIDGTRRIISLVETQLAPFALTNVVMISLLVGFSLCCLTPITGALTALSIPAGAFLQPNFVPDPFSFGQLASHAVNFVFSLVMTLVWVPIPYVLYVRLRERVDGPAASWTI